MPQSRLMVLVVVSLCLATNVSWGQTFPIVATAESAKPGVQKTLDSCVSPVVTGIEKELRAPAHANLTTVQIEALGNKFKDTLGTLVGVPITVGLVVDDVQQSPKGLVINGHLQWKSQPILNKSENNAIASAQRDYDASVKSYESSLRPSKMPISAKLESERERVKMNAAETKLTQAKTDANKTAQERVPVQKVTTAASDASATLVQKGQAFQIRGFVTSVTAMATKIDAKNPQPFIVLSIEIGPVSQQATTLPATVSPSDK